MPFRFSVLVVVALVLTAPLGVFAQGPSLYDAIDDIQSAFPETIWQLVYISHSPPDVDGRDVSLSDGIIRFRDDEMGILLTMYGPRSSLDSIHIYTEHRPSKKALQVHTRALALMKSVDGLNGTIDEWVEINEQRIKSKESRSLRPIIQPEVYSLTPVKLRNNIIRGDVNYLDDKVSYGILIEYEEVERK